MTQQETLARLVAFYQTLEASKLNQLADIYHSDICLADPVGEHRGLPVVSDYFSSLLKNLRYCRFDVSQTHHFENNALLIWRMFYAHPSLQGGAEQTLEGSSYIQFRDDKISFQRDYYDMGAMLYEKIPVLGSVIRQLKKRLQP